MRTFNGISRKDKLMNVDLNRENLYNLCINNPLTLKEIKDTMQLSMYKIKAYVGELVKNNHLEKCETGSTENNHIVVKFKSTESVFKARSIEELDQYFIKQKETVRQLKKYPYDDLIANNPNLRKISLFDTKPTSDFLSAQVSKVNRQVSSAWSMYDSF